MSSNFVISLDFELMWGVRDSTDRDSYGACLLGARNAVPRMLDLFAENDLRATWATVGFLFCESRDELIASLPKPELRPRYKNTVVSNYSYLNEVGRNEQEDPYYYASSLVKRIAETPGQEIGTHTLSHYYCLEDGQTLENFEADIRAAQQLAQRRGITLRSIVFPRNQYGLQHLNVCARLGLTAFRGNPQGWAFTPSKSTEQTLTRRALRLADAYSGVLGSQTFLVQSNTSLANVSASRYMRPKRGLTGQFHALHLRTILRGMTTAAERGESYHLWWHPHDFGLDQEANMAGLRMIVAHFRDLQQRNGMTSRCMADFAADQPRADLVSEKLSLV